MRAKKKPIINYKHINFMKFMLLFFYSEEMLIAILLHFALVCAPERHKTSPKRK